MSGYTGRAALLALAAAGVVALTGHTPTAATPNPTTTTTTTTIAAAEYAVSPIIHDLTTQTPYVGGTVTLNATCPPTNTHTTARVDIAISSRLGKPIVARHSYELPITDQSFTFTYTIPPEAEPNHPDFSDQENYNHLFFFGRCGTGEFHPDHPSELTEDDYIVLVRATGYVPVILSIPVAPSSVPSLPPSIIIPETR